MRTNQNQNKFVADVLSKIERRQSLYEYYNDVFLPTLKKFDGKVYNIRFIKALRENASELMYVRELENDHIVVECRKSKFSYTDYESIYIMVKLKGGRIDHELSITDELGKKWVENFLSYTEDLRMCVTNYDEYIKVAEKVRDAIEEYAKLPLQFRENIRFTRGFYIK